jgi:drug/metabolite transporter (DMT)-like permease
MKLKTFLAFAAIYVIWGSTYLAILIGIKDIPPFLMSAIRFLTAGVLLFAWCNFKKLPKASFSDWKKNSIYGILLLFGGTVSVTWSEQYIPSSVAAIIVAAVPLWFVLLDKRQWRFYFSNKPIIAGLVIGLLGVIILTVLGKESRSGNFDLKYQVAGILVIVGGGIAWAIGSLYAKYYPSGTSLLTAATIQLFSAGTVCFVVSVLSGESRNFSFENVSLQAWMGLSYLIIMGSLVAYLSYLYLLARKPPVLVGTYVYVNPIVAILLGAAVAGEQVTLAKAIAIILILCGVILVNLRRYKPIENK